MGSMTFGLDGDTHGATAPTTTTHDLTEAWTRDAERIVASLDAATRGDLTRPVGLKGDDAMSLVGAAVDRLLGALRGSLASIGADVAHVARAADLLTSVAAELAAVGRPGKRCQEG